jgi:hypothetical protein
MQATIEKGDRCEVGCMPQRPLGRVGQILFERNLGSKLCDPQFAADIRFFSMLILAVRRSFANHNLHDTHRRSRPG